MTSLVGRRDLTGSLVGRRDLKGSLAGKVVNWTSYIDIVLGKNPYAYWTLNETSGSTADNAEGTTARDGTYTGVTLNDDNTNLGPAPYFDGANDYVDIYSSSLEGAIDSAEGSMFTWAKVDSAAWTDATTRYFLQIRASANDWIYLRKDSATDRVSFEHRGNATSVGVTDTSLAGSTAWFPMALTWSVSGNALKAYLLGAQVGTTQTGVTAWADTTLDSLRTLIGASITTPGNVQQGHLQHCALFDTVLSLTDIQELSLV